MHFAESFVEETVSNPRQKTAREEKSSKLLLEFCWNKKKFGSICFLLSLVSCTFSPLPVVPRNIACCNANVLLIPGGNMAGGKTGITGHGLRFKSSLNSYQLRDVDNLLSSLSTWFLNYKMEILIHTLQSDYGNRMK